MAKDLQILGELIAEQAAHMDAAEHRLLTNIREFDRREGWASLKSCAEWLSWRVGWTPGTARERVRVARALGSLPHIDEALRLGKVSYCKVRAMTRVATPANEQVLLMDAQLTTASQLERVCRKYRGATRESSPSSRTSMAIRCRSAAGRARFRRRSRAHCASATPAAGSRAARIACFWKATT